MDVIHPAQITDESLIYIFRNNVLQTHKASEASLVLRVKALDAGSTFRLQVRTRVMPNLDSSDSKSKGCLRTPIMKTGGLVQK